MDINFDKVNEELKEKSPGEIISWATSLPQANPVLTTNFGPFEAAILHATTFVQPDVKVLWCDSGYNTSATYKFAHKIIITST